MRIPEGIVKLTPATTATVLVWCKMLIPLTGVISLSTLTVPDNPKPAATPHGNSLPETVAFVAAPKKPTFKKRGTSASVAQMSLSVTVVALSAATLTEMPMSVRFGSSLIRLPVIVGEAEALISIPRRLFDPSGTKLTVFPLADPPDVAEKRMPAVLAVISLPVIVGRAVWPTSMAIPFAVITLFWMTGSAGFTTEFPLTEMGDCPLSTLFSIVPPPPARKLKYTSMNVTPSTSRVPSIVRERLRPSSVIPGTIVSVAPATTPMLLVW